MQLGVFGLVDHAHAAATQLLRNSVVRYRPVYHWKFLINTASSVFVPRERARRPSGNQSNQKISSEAKCVTGFGGPPATGCSQMLSTPFTVLTKETAWPSGVK